MISVLKDNIGNVIGSLPDALSAIVIEERNGIFELEFQYPYNYPYFDDIEEDNLITAKPNSVMQAQDFRIYRIIKDMSGKVFAYARHISFDIIGDYIHSVSLVNASCEHALNELFRNSIFCKHYIGHSDIVNAQDYNISLVSLQEALQGARGSIIDTYGNGAEILRDNEEIHVLQRRGHDNGVYIIYGENLTDIEYDRDRTGLITGIKPYAKKNDTEYFGDIVYSPLLVKGKKPKIKPIDFSSYFEGEEVPTKAKLEELASNYFRDNKCDIPKENYKLDFIELSRCVGYENVNDALQLCDTVTIEDSRYNIATTAKVVKYKYDSINEVVEGVELGYIKTSLGDVIGGSSGSSLENTIKDVVNQIPSTNYPNTLPNVSQLKGELLGFSDIALSWTFESKPYYSYEVYASKTRNFTPNEVNRIFQGKGSTHTFNAKPSETWYFKVCCINSHGNRNVFSNEVSITTIKIDDLENYVDSMAIGNAIVNVVNAGHVEANSITARILDVKGNFSVTNGNGKRTFDIDSNGDVTLLPTTFKMLVEGQEEDVITQGIFEAKNAEFEFRFENDGKPNLVPNGNPKPTNIDRWRAEGEGGFLYTHNPNWIGIANNNTQHEVFGFSDYIPIKEGEGYSFSIKVQKESNVSSMDVFLIGSTELGGGYDQTWHVFQTGDTDEHWIKYNFTPRSDIKYIRIRIDNNSNISGQAGAYVVWFWEAMLIQGYDVFPEVWYPSQNDVYNNISTVDRDGMKIKHDSGSHTRVSSKELYQTQEDGARSIAIRNGGMRLYGFDVGNIQNDKYLGGVTSVTLRDTGHYGVSYFGTGNSDIVDLGFADTTEDAGVSIAPWMRLRKEGSTFPGLTHDVTMFKSFNARNGGKLQGFFDFTARPRMQVGIGFPYADGDNSEVSYITTTAPSVGYRGLYLIGADGINLALDYGDLYSGHRMKETADTGYVYHECWGHWNFHNYRLNNAVVTKSLSDPSLPIDARNKAKPLELQSIMANKELIQYRAEDETVNGECIVLIPNEVKYSIGRYDVNIIKYGRGDIWVSERHYDYFVVQSDNDIKFTWVLEGEEKETLTKLASRPNYFEPAVDEVEEGESANPILTSTLSKYALMDDKDIDKSIEIEKLLRENKLYKLYTKEGA